MKKYTSPMITWTELAAIDIITLSTGNDGILPQSKFIDDKSGWLPY